MPTYVTVGSDEEELGNGYIYASADGVNWNLVLELQGIDEDVSKRLYDVANDGQGEWIVTGDEGIYRSTDGVNWDGPFLVDDTAYMMAVHYAHGLWMVGGNQGNLYTSADGVTWNAVGSAFPPHNEFSIYTHTISSFDNGWYVGTPETTGVEDGDYSGWYTNNPTGMSGWQGFLFTGYGPDTDGDLAVVYDISTAGPDSPIGSDVIYGGRFNGAFTGLGDGLFRIDEINDFPDTNGGLFTDNHVYGSAYSPTLNRWVLVAGASSYNLDGELVDPDAVAANDTQHEIRGVVWSSCDNQFVYVGTSDEFT